MKLQVHEFYQTRDGRKAYVSAQAMNPFEPPVSVFCGFIEGSPNLWAWRDEDKESDWYPIEKLKHPVSIEVWAAWADGKVVALELDKESTRRRANSNWGGEFTLIRLSSFAGEEE